MNSKLGIYVHIPFCRSKCNYCDFYSLPGALNLFDMYEKALRRHIKESAEFLEDRDIDSIYFGGGTPTHYGAKHLVGVLSELGKRFYVASDCEVTLEANPESIEYKDMLKLRRAGFNRVSIGVQSTDNDQLKTLGRPHNWEDAKRAVGFCREAGFKNVSIDLMYGLPGQTLSQWQDVLGEALMTLDPEHISCYGLKIEKGTPFYVNEEHLVFPDDDAQADMYLYAAKTLTENDYIHYEISNFAKRGRQSRHNLKYWNMEEYLGFGPSAHSDLNGSRFACIRDVRHYINNISTGQSVMTDLEEISKKVRLTEYIMLGLRTRYGVSASELESRYGEDFEKLRPYFKRLISGGFARQFEDRFSLTAKGWLVSNTIINDVLDYL